MIRVSVCVSSFVSSRLRQRSTRRFAYPRTEQTSVSPECWYAAHFFGKQVRSRFIATTWPSLVAGAAANWLQDCRSRVSVSARNAPAYLSVDLRSIKDLPSRQRLRSSDMLAVPTSNLSTVGDRAYPIAAARVWNSVAGRSVIQFFINVQASAQDWAFLTELPWLKCMNFRYICKVASQIWISDNHICVLFSCWVRVMIRFSVGLD